jgi:pyridoxamine 5'-phosphate oxidase-like protein
MSPGEVDAFLAGERTCRVATIGPDGPHATPLWFGWDSTYLWLYSIVKSQRWADLQRDPRIGVTVDSGIDKYMSAPDVPNEEMFHDGRHGWLRVTPTKITSWDFRKLAAL